MSDDGRLLILFTLAVNQEWLFKKVAAQLRLTGSLRVVIQAISEKTLFGLVDFVGGGSVRWR